MSRRTQTQKRQDAALRRTRIAEEYIPGVTLKKDLAAKYGVSHTVIANDLNKIVEEWRKIYADRFNDIVVTELRRLDRVEAAAWEAWEQSKTPTRVVSRKQGVDGKSKIDLTEAEFTIDENDQIVTTGGNAQYLAIVLKCIDHRFKVAGAYSQTVNMTGGGGGDRIIVTMVGND